MAEAPIHIITINKEFSSPKELIEEARLEVGLLKGKPTIILLPEAALGEKPISKGTAKELAGNMGTMLEEVHGNAYVAYSVFQSTPRGRLVANMGYLVSPKKGKGRNYGAYPKISTFRRGKHLTEFDENVLRKQGLLSKETLGRIFRLIRRVQDFPSIKIAGRTIELRICSDVIKKPGKDEYLPQRRRGARKSKPQVILVPARNLPANSSNLQHLRWSLHPNGIVVFNDLARKAQGIVHLKHDKPAFKPDKTLKHGVFRIRHK